MPKVSFRMASASRESVFGVQTNTARKIDRSDHTEGRLTTAPSGCCVRKGTRYGDVQGVRSRQPTVSRRGSACGHRWSVPSVIVTPVLDADDVHQCAGPYMR